MSHLPADTLWTLAQAEAPEPEAAAHLAACPACREALDDVRRADRKSVV